MRLSKHERNKDDNKKKHATVKQGRTMAPTQRTAGNYKILNTGETASLKEEQVNWFSNINGQSWKCTNE